MNIGIDLDNTLFPLRTIEKVSIELGFSNSYTQKDATDWSLSNIPFFMKRRIKEYWRDPEYMKSLEPYPETYAVLKGWKDLGHNIFVITARTKSVHFATIESCNKHFPALFDGIQFVEPRDSKQPIIKDLAIDIWIDDEPMECQRSVYNDIKTYMISNDDTRYNWYLRDWDLLSNVEHISDI